MIQYCPVVDYSNTPVPGNYPTTECAIPIRSEWSVKVSQLSIVFRRPTWHSTVPSDHLAPLPTFPLHAAVGLRPTCTSRPCTSLCAIGSTLTESPSLSMRRTSRQRQCIFRTYGFPIHPILKTTKNESPNALRICPCGLDRVTWQLNYDVPSSYPYHFHILSAPVFPYPLLWCTILVLPDVRHHALPEILIPHLLRSHPSCVLISHLLQSQPSHFNPPLFMCTPRRHALKLTGYNLNTILHRSYHYHCLISHTPPMKLSAEVFPFPRRRSNRISDPQINPENSVLYDAVFNLKICPPMTAVIRWSPPYRKRFLPHFPPCLHL